MALLSDVKRLPDPLAVCPFARYLISHNQQQEDQAAVIRQPVLNRLLAGGP